MSSSKPAALIRRLVLLGSLSVLAALLLLSARAGASPASAAGGALNPGVVDFWGGARTFIALRIDGTVWTWGWNDFGVLGNGLGVAMNDLSTASDELYPFQVLGPGGVGHLTSIVAIAGGERHNAALDASGEVWTWGWNGLGQLGNGVYCTSDINSTACMGATPAKIPGFSSVKAIASRGYHTLALKTDGTVWAWGDNDGGRLGDGTTTERHSPVQVSGLDAAVHGGVKQISGGGVMNMALMADNTLLGWGQNDAGAVGNGAFVDQYTPAPVSQATGLASVQAVATGWEHVVALAADGTVWTWGQNHDGELGDGITTNRNVPYHVPGLTNVRGVSAGDAHTIVVKKDGTVWAWGDNRYGQLGLGITSTLPVSTPVQVVGLSGVILVRGRNFNSLAMKSDGTVWAWGDNGRGVGDGSRGADKLLPAQVGFSPFLTEALFLPALRR